MDGEEIKDDEGIGFAKNSWVVLWGIIYCIDTLGCTIIQITLWVVLGGKYIFCKKWVIQDSP